MKRYSLKISSPAISLSYICSMLFVFLLVSGNFSATAQENREKNASKDMNAEREIIQLENKIFEAIKNRDAKQLESLLVEDFVYRTHDGKESNKVAFLEIIKSFPLKILSVKGENLKAEIFGDVAVLSGVQRAKVKMDDGRLVEGLGAFMDVFVKRNERWLLKSAFNVELPSVDESQKNNN